MTQNETLTRTLLLVVAAIILLPILSMAFMMPMMGMWGWGHMADTGMWGVGGGSWVWVMMWVIPLVLIGGLGYLFYRSLSGVVDESTDPALEELRIAYARGDISDEEFERRRQRLGESE
ncbi:putative membrane protein [Halogranum gelatinilyticum]|uniref:Putative membrane protein n=1 Tax=Halogranum gelatinilyticum TaxID=660521 RepID=A0A1G9R593_9EURY|nr:SHOCT domain-containing protein [Halogranum gelatinilyticum]SDM18449.1 putative membrane protein [Halogranum gelatinilyticum]